MERFVRLIKEKAIMIEARSWYSNCVLAGRLKISSSVDPTISIRIATRIGMVVLSNLKRKRIANIAGMVIASPPKEVVTPSCIAFSLLS